MIGMKKHLSITINIMLGIAALAFFFIIFEIALKIYQAKHGEKENIPLYITTDKPYLYRMNPKHKRVNSFGLRDDEFTQEKPDGVYRILVLGDSIPYGRVVGKKQTFPNQLEKILLEKGQKVEVINAGVSGYSPYNELYYYLEEGRKFKPDLVIISFCMNDVANPRFHWGYTQEKITHIPDEAIPNKTYDREVIQPMMAERQESLSRKLDGARSLFSALVKNTSAYQFIAAKMSMVFPDETEQKFQKRLPQTEAALQTHITAEDNISIEVLTHRDSEEWRWLTGLYQKIHRATESDGIPLVLAIFPVAYQLDENYPHHPETLFSEYCTAEKIDCVDMLKPFRHEGKEKIFMLDKERGYDIWHLTEDGHRVTANVLYQHLLTSGYVH